MTSSDSSEGNFVKMVTFPFQCTYTKRTRVEHWSDFSFTKLTLVSCSHARGVWYIEDKRLRDIGRSPLWVLTMIESSRCFTDINYGNIRLHLIYSHLVPPYATQERHLWTGNQSGGDLFRFVDAYITTDVKSPIKSNIWSNQFMMTTHWCQ